MPKIRKLQPDLAISTTNKTELRLRTKFVYHGTKNNSANRIFGLVLFAYNKSGGSLATLAKKRIFASEHTDCLLIKYHKEGSKDFNLIAGNRHHDNPKHFVQLSFQYYERIK